MSEDHPFAQYVRTPGKGPALLKEAKDTLTGTIAIALKMVTPDETSGKPMAQVAKMWQSR